jgi:hypothetical protein
MKRSLEELEDYMNVLKEKGITEAHYSVETQEKDGHVIAVLQITAQEGEKDRYYIHRQLLFNGIVQEKEEAQKEYFNKLNSGVSVVIKEFQRFLPACRLFKGWIVP